MAEIVSLHEARRKKQAEVSFFRWEKRLGYRPEPEATLLDLPDRVVGALSELGPQATLALYDLVLGVRGWGAGERFHYLDPKPKVEALDAFLYLADQVRFELMRRLGWVYPQNPRVRELLDMAVDPGDKNGVTAECLPALSPSCPRYDQYLTRMRIEPGAVVRSLIPEALNAFRLKLNQS